MTVGLTLAAISAGAHVVAPEHFAPVKWYHYAFTGLTFAGGLAGVIEGMIRGGSNEPPRRRRGGGWQPSAPLAPGRPPRGGTSGKPPPSSNDWKGKPSDA
jgi:hypothetical protein